MPTMVIEAPLSVACVFSDGSRAEFALDDVLNPRLARDLAYGLVELVHPHGAVDAAGSVGHYVRALRTMIQILAEQGFQGGVVDLRRGMLAQFWMAGPTHLEALTRSLVEGFARSGGVLGQGVLDLAAGRHFNIQPNRQALPPYPESDWERLIGTSHKLVDESYAAHRQALVAVATGWHPAEDGWTVENFCWLLARTGPLGTPQFAQAVGVSVNVFRKRDGMRLLHEAIQAAFPHLDTLIAYRLLFGIHSGIVPDGIADLCVDDIDWAGDSTVLLSYVKGRIAAESLSLPRSAVRLLEQWLAHSSLLRSLVPAPERDKLWLGMSQPGNARLVRQVDRAAVHRWVRRFEVLDQDGQPLKVHRARIRTTHQAMRDKSTWTGSARATIDPNHTPAVEGDHYLTATTPAQRHNVETIVEDAQHDLIRRAEPPAVLTEEETAALVRDYPQLIAALNLDDQAIADLVGGSRDVFTAACGDQLSGLHGPVGKPCPARPWVCLLCPLAIFAPRHAANLLRLKAFFSRQWRQMPTAHFMAVFGPSATRIDQVLDRFAPAVLAAATTEVADTDEEIPLRPEEQTA